MHFNQDAHRDKRTFGPFRKRKDDSHKDEKVASSLSKSMASDQSEECTLIRCNKCWKMGSSGPLVAQ